MAFITSLLALAAIFVVLATLTTAFVETIHGLTKQRVKGLEQLAGAMFDNLFLAEKNAKSNRALFVREMTTNPAAAISDPNKLPLIGTLNSGKFDWLDLRRFVQQLANTEIGDALANNQKTLERRLTEIAANFERYAEGMTALFQRRAGIYAGIAGVGLAAFMNVDGALLADRLFNDAGLAQKVVVALPPDKLEKLIADQETFRKECGGDNAGTEKCRELAARTLEVGQADLEGLGLPIGKSYFPYCEGATPAAASALDPRCQVAAKPGTGDSTIVKAVSNLASHPELGLSWLLSILVTGALIGLGAPFWFNLYKSIASFAPVAGAAGQVGRAIGLKNDKEGTEPLTPAPRKDSPLTPEDLVTIFKLARAK
jgi:hypothetical protein